MPNADISRHLQQPRKHYSGARLQQGRPLLDSDFNEGAEARADLWRTALVDIVGAAGSQDDGFMPALKAGDTVTSKLVRFGASTQAFVLDYPLKAGSMYVGGSLWEQAAAEPVIFQRGFLQMGAATAPRAGLGEHRQLSYLRGWEQPVTAVEDGELLEPSLSGADSAARVRRVRRVEVRNVQATDCAAAFAEVLEDLGHGDTATYDAPTCELRSNARLQMTFQGSAAADCGPCRPSLEGRYLGGESHAIRIMLTAPDRYVWAYDNAAPLYRVRLVLDGAGGSRVEMLTPPKDTFHHPRQQTVVEFLPWEALLDNGRAQDDSSTGATFVNEKVAARVGVLAEVDGPYDPAARTFHVRLAPGSAQQIGVGQGTTGTKGEKQAAINLKTGTAPEQDGLALRWDPRHPFDEQLNPTENSPDGFVTYLYMRVWHLTQTGEALTIPTSSDRPLGLTGLVPVFTGRGRPGDFWTIAVRPEAPDEILPRELMLPGGVPPHGPLEVVAQLCLLTWRSLTGVDHELVRIDDCRPTVPPLIQRGCSTYEVGPGGDFPTIQAAVDALPVSGGRISVRAGVYREEVRIAGKSNVVVAGCGPRARIESPPAASGEALVQVELGEAGHDVTLRDLAVRADGQLGVRIVGGSRVELRGLAFRQTPGTANTLRSAVHTLGTGNVRISDCRVEMSRAFTHHAALYLDAPAGAVVERNTVATFPARDDRAVFAWGGIHVAGGSRGVEIRDNVIRGGRGHGVTLGSVVFRALDGTRLGLEGAGRGQSNPAPPFSATGVLRPFTFDPDGTGAREFFPEPQAAVDDLIVSDNRIEGAGGSGISSLALQVEHDERATRAPLCYRRTTFALTNAVIEGNRLVDNARQRATSDGESVAVGGIVLSEAARVTVRGNLVEGSGAATTAPVCGIGVARGEHVSVVGNRVRGNGPPEGLPDPDRVVNPRYHGGIVVAPPLSREAELPGNIQVRRNVVDQPAAPALFVMSRGACQVTANQFHTHRPPGPLLAETVLVFSAGKPWEAVDLPEGEPSPNRWLQPNGSREHLNGRAQDLPDDGGGALCFNGNQVTTNAQTTSNLGGFAATLLSLDHVAALGNQFAARGFDQSPLPQVAAIGLTTDVAVNRVAESINRTDISLGVLGAMLTACADNILTHCPVVVSCGGNRVPDFFIAEDNLAWFQPPTGTCAETGGRVIESLQRLCGLFGPVSGLVGPRRIDLMTNRGGRAL
jgi:Family of unknown function (DUF6519)